MTSVSKLERGDVLLVDAQRCSSLPPFSEMFQLNASSPNSVSSSASSSMAELFTASPEVIEKDGGDASSSVYPTASRHDSDRLFNDCNHVSLDSNVPSPIVEEGPCTSTNEGDVDQAMGDVHLNKKSPLEETCLSHSCYRQDSSSDDMFMSRLDELLQADASQEFAGESAGLASVDDLFPSWSNTGQDFPMHDGMSFWPMESLQSLDALPFPQDALVQVESASDGGEESASQMFEQWQQNNAHRISMSDLRKIKLKTTTIENTIRRLGGGKRGSMLFLKFVLQWVQNSQMKGARVAEAMSANGALSSVTPSGTSPASGLTGGLTWASEILSERDSSSALESSCAIRAPGTHGHAITGCSSPSVHPTVRSPGSDWSLKAQWPRTPGAELNGSFRTTNRSAPPSNGRTGIPLPRSTFGHSDSAWPLHGNMPRSGVTGATAVQPSLRSSASRGNSCSGGGGMGAPASVMMVLQQQECSDANPAATTRAARKSRMERQRWSVRRNRKWSTAAQQRQQSLAPAVSNGGVHASLPPCSQLVGNMASPNFPLACSRSNPQPLSNSRSTAMENQHTKKSERNLKLLFHKQLKQSDVGNLGRIVLPKAAETCLPPLDLRDSVNLAVEDINSAKIWSMRYRFWPNNKSRMYLLENTGDFVKSYDLKEDDYMMLYWDSATSTFVIKGAKGRGRAAAEMSGTAGIEDIADGGKAWNVVKRSRRVPNEEEDLVFLGSMNSEGSCDDSLLAELIEQSLEDVKESSETEMFDPIEPV